MITILTAKSAHTDFYSSPWHLETDCNIALLILEESSTMIWLHRVNIWCPVTPEFKRVKCAHPFVDQQFGYVRLAERRLDLALISTVFSGANGRSLLSFSPIC